MSTIIKFYTAPNDDVAEQGPGRDAVDFGDFDVFASLEEWESLLLDRPLDDVDGPEQVNDEESPLILALLPALTRALARADIDALARSWVAVRSAEGEKIDPAVARRILTGLAGLARSRRPVFCSVS
ncbi:hypothetical protein [Actinoplanes siamensis]|uniref:Uncharacterized protein n=1 Tax=Actinoplanes siamensis TaxID=1223317 RepID=A0A919N338_9ACTN|nr:hypothetical protein [Actinoplanes siamensis]GIF03358.1 hypothetical protein Asi03nite_08960 [Actinoplanes siamensis]